MDNFTLISQTSYMDHTDWLARHTRLTNKLLMWEDWTCYIQMNFYIVTAPRFWWRPLFFSTLINVRIKLPNGQVLDAKPSGWRKVLFFNHRYLLPTTIMTSNFQKTKSYVVFAFPPSWYWLFLTIYIGGLPQALPLLWLLLSSIGEEG